MSKRKPQTLSTIFAPTKSLPEEFRFFEGIPPEEVKRLAAEHPEKWRKAIEAFKRERLP